MNNYINQPSEREFNHNRLQYGIAKDLIKDLNLENKEVLDFGGGNGEFSYFLKNRAINWLSLLLSITINFLIWGWFL